MSGSHELVRTKSGALAVRSVADDEVMHPGVGPRVEAETLYVAQSRLAGRLAAAPLTLFDVGLGAGSNAFAALAVAARAPHPLTLVSFERDLGALALALTQPADFGIDAATATAAHELVRTGTDAAPHATWHLRHGELLPALAGEPTRADVVFWDPFSPRANPALWTVDAFAEMRRLANDRCTLFTYSASTATRVAMLLAGWAVGAGDAIGDKRETTAAAVRVEDLARPLDARFLARVRRSSAVLPEGAVERLALLPQLR